MWKYKSCPRCHGDIFVEEDVDNSYLKCLQCGYERVLTPNFVPERKQVVHRKSRVASLLG